MMPFRLIFLIVALCFFAVAALGVSVPRLNAVATGLFFLTLSMLVL